MPRRPPHALLPGVVRLEAQNLVTGASAEALLEKADRDDIAPLPRAAVMGPNPRRAAPRRADGFLDGPEDLVPARLSELAEGASIVDAAIGLAASADAAEAAAEVHADDALAADVAAVAAAAAAPPQLPAPMPPRRVNVARLVALVAGLVVAIALLVVSSSALGRAARLRKCAERGGEACARLDELDVVDEGAGVPLGGGARRRAGTTTVPRGHWAALV